MKMKKKILLTLLVLGVAGGVLLYRKWDRIFPKDQWTVTQYGPREMNSSFYTIYNPKRGLIVVDGGWVEDAAYVRKIISSLGKEVDAWILTHPHQDHIGAFNALYPDLGDIQVGEIYTVEMASPEVCQERAPWDSVAAYNDFLALHVPDLIYVHEGDILNLCGLEVDIFSAYGEEVETRSKDYLNDGSMMFKVKGENQSFLFCADVGKSMSKYLLKRWGDDLKTDYLQMGHHGYGGLRNKFYRKVSPQVAFFDAPDWLMNDDTGMYDNPEHADLMRELGSRVVSFNSVPNSVILE